MTLRKSRALEIERGILYLTVWITCFGRGYGPVIRHSAE
jgi:hypothetical protein